MKTVINYFFLVSVITGISNAKDICQEVMNGKGGEDVPVEDVNRCYKCDGWNEVIEGQVTPAVRPSSSDEDVVSGWSWCAESVEVRFELPIKLGGFTITSVLPNKWVKEMTVTYEDDNADISGIRNTSGYTVFQGNVDDYSIKENKFLLPIKTTNIHIRVLSHQSAPCFNVRLYSCDKAIGSKSVQSGENAPLFDTSVGNTGKCEINVTTDCPSDVKCFIYLTDSDGCDRCACDETFSGTIEGDIIVDSSSRYMIETEYGMRKEDYNIQRAGIKGEYYRWKDHKSGNNYIVPYILDGSLSSKGRSAISEAMAEIEKAACIRFQQRANEPNYLKFFRGGGCYSYVGNVRSGDQEVSIGYGCEYVGTAQHEIFHALGFFHEQSRSDRDEHVNIFFENILSGRESNFEKRDHQDFESPYDLKSIMHYSNGAFSANGQDTIQAKNEPDLRLGQRRGLTIEDKAELNRMYQCSGSGTVTTEPTATTTTSTIVTTTTTIPSTCGNNEPDWACDYWQGKGYCKGIYEFFMKGNCAKSCGTCGKVADERCKDLKPNCNRKKRHCTSRNPRLRRKILKRCQKTCNQC